MMPLITYTACTRPRRKFPPGFLAAIAIKDRKSEKCKN